MYMYNTFFIELDVVYNDIQYYNVSCKFKFNVYGIPTIYIITYTKSTVWFRKNISFLLIAILL